MPVLSSDAQNLRIQAREALCSIALKGTNTPEERTSAAAVLLQDIAIEENS